MLLDDILSSENTHTESVCVQMQILLLVLTIDSRVYEVA